MRKTFMTFIALMCVLNACQVDTIESPVASDETTVWDIRLRHQAVLMSTGRPFDTITLQVIPRNSLGIGISSEGTITYRTSSRDISVDSAGVVHALNATARAWVVAELVDGNLRYIDSASIVVINSVPADRTIRLSVDVANPRQPILSGLTGLWTQADKPVLASITHENGTPISGVPVRYWVRDSSIASVQPYAGLVRGFVPGKKTWVFAGVTYFGQLVLDSVEVEITEPLYVTIGTSVSYTPGSTVPVIKFLPAVLEVGAGVTVRFNMHDTLPYDVIFDDSLLVSPGRLPNFIIPGLGDANPIVFGPLGGNIDPEFPDKPLAYARTFAEPGTYRYRSRKFNSEGTLIVK